MFRYGGRRRSATDAPLHHQRPARGKHSPLTAPSPLPMTTRSALRRAGSISSRKREPLRCRTFRAPRLISGIRIGATPP